MNKEELHTGDIVLLIHDSRDRVKEWRPAMIVDNHVILLYSWQRGRMKYLDTLKNVKVKYKIRRTEHNVADTLCNVSKSLAEKE